MKREDVDTLSGAEAALVPRAEPDAWAEVTLTVNGKAREIEVECYGKTYPRVADTHSTPGQPGGFVIEELKYQGTYLTHLFTQDQLDSIAREVSP